jgi:nicotinate-nucleotide adenylyltransferase
MHSIGILGGTFDPVHYGHLRLAEEALEPFALSHVRLIPAAIPPHRNSPHAASEHRIAMCHLAVESNEALVVDAREAQREGKSYTIDTLASLNCEMPDAQFHLLLGADAFLALDSWHRWRELFGLCHVIVAGRPGFSLARDAMSLQLRTEFDERLVQTAHELQIRKSGKIAAFAMTPLDISASGIRDLIRQGRSPRYLLPDSVVSYIETHFLYRPERDDAR